MSAITSPTGELLSGYRPDGHNPSVPAKRRSRVRQPATSTGSVLQTSPRSLRAALTAGFADAGTERVDWVDAAKGICVLLMVFGHVVGGLAARDLVGYSSVGSQLNIWKYEFNMPGLFVLCGLFLSSACRRSIKTFVTRRASALLYPAILFGALTVGASNFRALLLPSVHHSTPLSLSWLLDPTVGMWTLSTLFWVSLAFAILVKIGLRAWQVAALAAAAFFAIGASGVAGTSSPATIAAHLLKYLSLLSIGAFLAPVLLESARRASMGALAAACLVGFGASFAAYAVVGVESALTAATVGAPGVLGMFCLAALITRARPAGWSSGLLQLLGRYSMQIFVLHSIAHAGTRFVLFRLMGIEDAWVLLSTSMFAGIVGPLAVVWVVNTFRIGYVFRFGPHERTLARSAKGGVVRSIAAAPARAAA